MNKTVTLLAATALLSLLSLLCCGSALAQAGPSVIESSDSHRVAAWIDAHLDGLLKTYRHLHTHPELSLQEQQTAELAARSLRQAGFEVQTGVGGHGVIGVLRNGDGPTVLIRGDMDALPVTEATGLEYASRARAVAADGSEVGVMHACGHDLHLTNLLGTAALLAELHDLWRGTLVIIAQPAEELGRGALMMIEDGLFERIPRPSCALALHVSSDLPVGQIGVSSGWAAANVDTVQITLYGRGGHGARPHDANDPIVTAAQLVTALQTLVSRRVSPTDTAVVTVGSIHGGAKSNVIPDRVDLALTVRSYKDEVRKLLLDGIAELAQGLCRAFACPRSPEIRIDPDATPAVYNDPELASHAVGVLRSLLGAEQVLDLEPTMTGEDFGRYARAGGFPGLIYWLGSVNPEKFRAAEQSGTPLPSLHSSHFAPDAPATLKIGLSAMAALALSLFNDT